MSELSNDQLIWRFRRALGDEIEAAQAGPSSEPIPLVAGRRLARIGSHTHYRFEAERTLPTTLVDGVEASVRIEDQAFKAIVVEHEGLVVTLGLPAELGPRIENAELVWDLAFLLERLADRLRERVGSENPGGDVLLGRATPVGVPADYANKELNAGQEDAVGHALGCSGTFIWGPPGTGKTRTIGALIAESVRRGRSVLLVSHTNVAVDEAMLRTATALGDDLPAGRVIRLGRAHRQELLEQPELLAETHAARREKGLVSRLSALDARRADLVARSLFAQQIVDLEEWTRRAASIGPQVMRLERALERAVNGGEQASIRVARRDFRVAMDELCEIPQRHGLIDAPESIEWIDAARTAALARLDGMDVAGATAEAERHNEEIADIDREIAELKARRERIVADLIGDAKVVACTLTAAYLRTAIVERTFDTVIIDEASMAPIPSAWFAASLASRAVVAVGDFRQLPPIVLAETPVAMKWLGRDVFEESGVRAAWERGAPPTHLRPLTVQHRMAPRISAIPNELYYGGILSDGPGVEHDGELGSWCDGSRLPNEVSVFDTGVLAPWATAVARGARSSRCNPVAAVACIDILEELLRKDRPELASGERPRALIITPYRPQAELLQAMLRARRLDREAVAGTAHSFQGSEASIVLLDLTLAEPHYRAGLLSTDHDEDHRRLLNVAVTRARRRLAVVADVDFIRRRAAERSTLQRLLGRARRSAPPCEIKPFLQLAEPATVTALVSRAERDVIWFAIDPEIHRPVAEAVAAAEARGISCSVVTSLQRIELKPLRDSAMAALRRADVALMAQEPARMSLIVVDGKAAALPPAERPAWSVWDDPGVAGALSVMHSGPRLLKLLDEGNASCGICSGVIVLRQTDHRGVGMYLRCSSCGTAHGAPRARVARGAR
jgi:AAA domain-containing protein